MDDAKENRIAPPVISIIHDTDHSVLAGSAPIENRTNKLGKRYREFASILFSKPEDQKSLDAAVNDAIRNRWITFNLLVYALAKDESCCKYLASCLPEPSGDFETMYDRLNLCSHGLHELPKWN